jgi:recombinational DNA repair protein RecR
MPKMQFDPLEEYYNSIGNHGEYLTRCPNCGLYTTKKYCSVDCEDNYRIAFS